MLRRVIADVLYLRGNGLLQQGAAAIAAQKAGDIDPAVRYAERALALDEGLDAAHVLLDLHRRQPAAADR